MLLLVACSAPAGEKPATLTVFAAASLTDAFTELGQGFEVAHPGVTVAFNFAGSQALRTQLEEGAQADVFASANSQEMEAAIATGLVAARSQQFFVSNALLVILPADNPAGITTLQELARPGVKLVLAAEEVPIGRYSQEVLANLQAQFGGDYQEQTLANVVSNEDNVRQVVAKVQLGEADAGIVYGSDAVSAPVLQTIPIPPEANVTATYPIAPLAAAQSELAGAFVAYVLSAEGQAVLAKWGFTPLSP
ncbi:MAG: molybdate ABC transporter substrate-binding protein [Chloroflexi bacterium]|nr:molybdate ABC transporter substrate-binding protein [Chloroflexota bacterium]MCI0578446.1 molybdate ABC transporter substrate-binding protein [Chloroflexota bacterium]MCI0643892.1 molybdate ABC transporter substrate-binding protein [Chloroflexota bacterium]MCI0729198.1 molybdate ABC transporter substrate-binding protein [Chloroflexota bacterium]